MKVIKRMLPMVIFLLVGLISQAQVETKTAAVNSKAKEATCQKVCTPVVCDAMVKLGLCTPEQAENCNKEGENVKTANSQSSTPAATKVASVSKERELVTPAAPEAKSTACAKVCAKKCSSTKKTN